MCESSSPPEDDGSIAVTVLEFIKGQTILVAMKETPDQIDGLRISRILRKRFPGVEFTLLTGVEGIGIFNAGK